MTKWTEERVYDMLETKFPAPAYVILPQVRNETGYHRSPRTADAIVVSTYPSRGIWAMGIEIKVSRSDWRNEAKDPGKADVIAKYCHYWYVAAPAGIVPLDEVPENWGLLECKEQYIHTAKVSPRKEPWAPDWLLMADVLRSAQSSMVTASRHHAELDQAWQSVADDTMELNDLRRQVADDNALRKGVNAFEESSGLCIDPWQAGDIGSAVAVVRAGGLKQVQANVSRIAGDMARAKALCDKMLTQLEAANET